MGTRPTYYEIRNYGSVAREQAAVLEPIGADLNRNNPGGDAVLLVTGKGRVPRWTSTA